MWTCASAHGIIDTLSATCDPARAIFSSVADNVQWNSFGNDTSYTLTIGISVMLARGSEGILNVNLNLLRFFNFIHFSELFRARGHRR